MILAETEMRRAMAITSIILLVLLSLKEFVQGFEGSAGTRTLKQENEQAHDVHCSRERSRAAWQIIEEYLMPFVEKEQYQISGKCRLHPDNDLFRDQEQHKIHVDINEWRCGYCKKIFRAEKFLDQHFDNRHYNLLSVNDSKCLADLCGALHCDFVLNSKSTKTKCNPAAVERNRHLCESLADSCFPVNHGPSSSRLHEANKYILLGYINIDVDAATAFLYYNLFVPKRNEKRDPGAEANRTSWRKSKTLIVGNRYMLVRILIALTR
ncbi:hypothetical protein HS088_TW18G00880 [Tripterygium wilfordii]|uniref:C2H2-type domain-containing protein n=1 Tax=Tripterygium wilfordii TaxID=458696 RepID=A0A7J7CDI2_TRIWF|nr:hypothetical protein HS088_TW18G00880 [Tripterygium wilfordii]